MAQVVLFIPKKECLKINELLASNKNLRSSQHFHSLPRFRQRNIKFLSIQLILNSNEIKIFIK